MGMWDNSALRVLLFCTASHEVVAEALSGAMTLLDGADGLALDFTDDTWLTDTGFYGSAAIVGGGSQDGYDSSPDAAASSLLTYTSASPKMLMGPSGTLRFQAHNLALQSETLSNAAWTNGSISSGSRTNGTVSVSGAEGYAYVASAAGIAVTVGATYTIAADVTCDSAISNVPIRYTFGGGASASQLTTFTAGQTQSVSLSVTPGFASVTLELGIDARDAIVPGGSNSTGYNITFNKVHVRRTPSDSTYLATTTAARYALPLQFTSAGVLEGLLVEEARTNLCLRSQEFNNASWTNNGTTISSNAVAAPDGTITADTIIETAAGGPHEASQGGISFTSGTAYTLTVYAKVTSSPRFLLLYVGGSGAFPASERRAWFNISSGSVSQVDTNVTATIESIGNGWYRCRATATANATASTTTFVALADAAGNLSYTGDGTSGLYVWGAQLEAGSFPTSYIPTIGSTVTRAADNISLATSAFPYSATAGTVYCYAKTGDSISDSERFWTLSNGTTDERIVAVAVSGGTLLGFVVDGGVTQANFQTANAGLSVNSEAKLAIAFAANDIAMSLEGGAVATDTSATLPTPTKLELGGEATGPSNNLNGIIKQIAYFPTRKANADLITLTT